jgi:DnaJ-class molecular chaperone
VTRTTLAPYDETALQKAHQIIGGIIEQDILHGINDTDAREARELIGNVLASTEDDGETPSHNDAAVNPCGHTKQDDTRRLNRALDHPDPAWAMRRLMDVCPMCDGERTSATDPNDECPTCHGTGVLDPAADDD